MKNFKFILILATSLLFLSQLVSQTPAIAGDRYDCRNGNLCSWEHANYDGARFSAAGNNSWWGAIPRSGGSWNDIASSFYNNGITCNVIVHKDVNYNGNWVNFPRYTGSSYIAAFNDKASSNQWCAPWGYPLMSEIKWR